MNAKLAMALGCTTLVFVACAAPSREENEPKETIGTTAFALRGADPTALRAPAYEFSIDSIHVDRTASAEREVWRPFVPYSAPHAFASVDKVRVGLDAQIQTSDGRFLTPVDSFDCQIGENIDGGALGTLQYTRAGSTYTRCLTSPFHPALAGARIRLAPVPVADADMLNLYAELSVLDPTDVWFAGRGPDNTTRDALTTTGTALGATGAVVSTLGPVGTVAGAVISVVGAVFSVVGYFLPPDPAAPPSVCQVTRSLVPGFGTADAPSDAASPVLRISLSGRQLYENTANGDALIAYDLDWGSMPGTTLCARPRTQIVVRVKRVVMEGEPSQPVRTRSSTVVAPESNLVDAFALDGSSLVHDARGYDEKAPLAWEAQGDLGAVRWVSSDPTRLDDPCAPPPTAKAAAGSVSAAAWQPVSSSTTGSSSKSGCYLPIFGRGAHIAALTRGPGLIDLYAIDAQGDLEWTYRDSNASDPSWHPWTKKSSGGLFPPGALIAAVSRGPHVADVFAIAADGTIDRFFQFDIWFSDPIPTTKPGMVRAYAGGHWGGIAAIAQPENDGAYAIGNDGQVISVWGDPLSTSWWYADHFAAATFHAPPGSQMAAVARASDRVDLFVVDDGGLVRTTSWNGAWSTTSQAISPDTLLAPADASLAVVARKVDVSTDPDRELTNNDHMDVFFVDVGGHVVDVPWRFGDDSYAWNPSRAHELAAVAAPGAEIGAFAPYAGAIFVAAKRSDGSLVKTWFEDIEATGIDWQLAP